MGFSTFIEMNHDMAHRVEDEPERVGQLLAQYMRACDRRLAIELDHQYGIRVWRSASRNEWQNEVRALLDQEYRELLRRVRVPETKP